VIPSSNLPRGFVGQTRGPHGDSGQRKWSEHVFPYDEPGVREIHFASGDFLLTSGLRARTFSVSWSFLGSKGQWLRATITWNSDNSSFFYVLSNIFEAFYGRPLRAVNTRISESCLFLFNLYHLIKPLGSWVCSMWKWFLPLDQGSLKSWGQISWCPADSHCCLTSETPDHIFWLLIYIFSISMETFGHRNIYSRWRGHQLVRYIL